jgi:hypothetical protein|nr:MAG TPA: hypothetical protein [Caudoviricetes sp.]
MKYSKNGRKIIKIKQKRAKIMHFKRFYGAFRTLLHGDRGTTAWKLG